MDAATTFCAGFASKIQFRNCFAITTLAVAAGSRFAAMAEEDPQRREVDQFILEEIDSVPHLEALLLLWNSRPRQWAVEELARSLYIPVERTDAILHDLQKRGLVQQEQGRCWWNGGGERESLMANVDRTYRRELVRISSMIHSKASPAVRQFARAFRLKKD